MRTEWRDAVATVPVLVTLGLLAGTIVLLWLSSTVRHLRLPTART